jgi:signal transduction histidine kinase
MLVLLRSEAHRYSIRMCTDLAADLPKATADRVQIRQVLMNLMLNGIEAMKETAGDLTIKSELGEDGQLLISVSDTGVGLPFRAWVAASRASAPCSFGLQISRRL